MKIPKISIIVPVYNVEQFLSNCIDSILEQTFTDFELLLIDDGSIDNSKKICDEYALKDSRVRVFYKENGGVSSARNVGLDNAQGEWIVFVDSDDCVSNRYLEDMYMCVNTDNLIIITNYAKEGIGNIIELRPIYKTKQEMVKLVLGDQILSLSAPYSKLYNRKIIVDNSIRFPSGINMGEDGIFIIKYLNCVDNIITIDKTNYFVRNTEGSLSSKYYSFESEWRCFNIWKNEIDYFIHKYGTIYSNPQEILWKNRICDTFNRCLLCLNRQKKNLTIKTQLEILKSIPIDDYIAYSNYYRPLKLRRKFLKYLICHRLFLLYIILGKLERKCKNYI